MREKIIRISAIFQNLIKVTGKFLQKDSEMMIFRSIMSFSRIKRLPPAGPD